MKLVIAGTGASGAIYLQRLLAQIDSAVHEVHLVLSGYARQVIAEELGELSIPPGVQVHGDKSMNVPFVSGSAKFDAMAVVPCSMGTLGRIATGVSDSVILRAADVFLKERRRLILVPRETPWSLIHARNVVTLLEAGAIVLPASPGFYARPATLEALVDSLVARILDQLGLPAPGGLSLGRRERRGVMKEKLLATLASWVIRALALTLRIDCHDLAGYFDPARRQPFIVASWHNRILLLPVVFERFRRGQRLAVLTSASRDGGLLAAVVQHFGVESVRGSSSRRGGLALRELHSKLDEGCDVIITPDGPRGPVYTLGPGLIFLAAQTGLPLMRVQVDYGAFWPLKSWDRFRIPKPFSRVVVACCPPARCPS